MYSCNHQKAKNEQIKTQEGWESLKENGYSIKYPEDWTLDKSGQNVTSFIILSLPTSSQDQFRENVNLLVQDLTGLNIDLEKYAQISEDQIKRLATNGKLIEIAKQTANGIDFQKVVYTFDQGIFKLKCEQYYWIKSNKAYVLTLTCEIDQFNNFKEVGEQILNSFIFQ
jgi:serine/threonine-protein kinase